MYLPINVPVQCINYGASAVCYKCYPDLSGVLDFDSEESALAREGESEMGR